MKKFLKKRHDGNFGDILGSLVVLLFMIVLLAFCLNTYTVLAKKIAIDREMRRYQLELEEHGKLPDKDFQSESEKFLNEYNLRLVKLDVQEGNYGEEVYVEILLEGTGRDLGLFTVGGMLEKTYEFGGRYTTISKAPVISGDP